MKSTDRQLFLRHQRRCVKCRLLGQVRKGQEVDRDLLRLLQLHESLMKFLYHQITAEDLREAVSRGLPERSGPV